MTELTLESRVERLESLFKLNFGSLDIEEQKKWLKDAHSRLDEINTSLEENDEILASFKSEKEERNMKGAVNVVFQVEAKDQTEANEKVYSYLQTVGSPYPWVIELSELFNELRLTSEHGLTLNTSDKRITEES